MKVLRGKSKTTLLNSRVPFRSVARFVLRYGLTDYLSRLDTIRSWRIRAALENTMRKVYSGIR